MLSQIFPKANAKPFFDAEKIQFSFQVGKWLVKTLDSKDEFKDLLKLRFQVFHKEFKGSIIPFGSDKDRFDDYADYIVIIDLETDMLVGSYRLISSCMNQEFYSEHEFEMSGFLKSPGIKLELGRACIAKEYRSGIVIGLLWKGVAEYMSRIKASYLFGCASVKITEARDVAHLLTQFENMKLINENFYIRPTKEFAIPNFEDELQLSKSLSSSEKMEIPSLFRTYIKAGAQIAGHPALDLEFKCVDFFTIMDANNINANFRRRFNFNQVFAS